MWRARERLQIDRPCDSIHAWVPSDRGESLCPVAKKPISENGESDQALASIASENFGLDPYPPQAPSFNLEALPFLKLPYACAGEERPHHRDRR